MALVKSVKIAIGLQFLMALIGLLHKDLSLKSH